MIPIFLIRLITHAEEVAFLDGSKREKEILSEKLHSVTTFSDVYYLLQFRQGIIDQYSIKYALHDLGLGLGLGGLGFSILGIKV